MAATRHCYVGQAAVNEFFSTVFGVHVDEHAVGGLSLTAVAGDGVAVVKWKGASPNGRMLN